METDLDLPALIQGKDHLNVLRYIRIHQLREPELVLKHGKVLLGADLNSKRYVNELARLAAIEQICNAALDCNDSVTAELCLRRLSEAGIEKSSTRFRLLLARCLEADGDMSGADIIYDALLKENPSNSAALKRKYCLLKSVPGKEVESVEALNAYLQQNYNDASAWYELAKQKQDIGDWKGATFCLEEVLLGSPASAKIHCELAECHATVGGLDNLLTARKHMAQALELDPANVRAKFGLVTVANAYLCEAAAKKKDADEFEVEVAKELLKYGTEQVLHAYNGTDMLASVKVLMKEYREGL
jgi:ER membrane protein complex subunit 2